MTRSLTTNDRILTIGVSFSELQSESETWQAFNSKRKTLDSNYAEHNWRLKQVVST